MSDYLVSVSEALKNQLIFTTFFCKHEPFILIAGFFFDTLIFIFIGLGFSYSFFCFILICHIV